MSEFISVLDLTEKKQATSKKLSLVVSKKKPAPKKKRGCEHCPLDSQPETNKVRKLKTVEGKPVFIWFPTPNAHEASERELLTGRPARFFWDELDKIGVKRSMCDMQYVVRCRPVHDDGRGYLADRPPEKEEIHCCSLYSDTALERAGGKAKVHLVVGQVAAKALLGREYRKDTPVFWSEKLQSKVVLLDHPSYFLSGGTTDRLSSFRLRLRAASKILTEPAGKFSYIRSQAYKLVKTARTAKRVIREALRQKTERVSVDIEDGIIDPDTGKAALEGVRVILSIAISWAPGKAWCFAIDHPDAFEETRSVRRLFIRLLGKLMSSRKVKKTLHHGTHDVKRMKELWGVKTRGYEFDTNYSTYFKWPAQKKYGLAQMGMSRVPEFSQYKEIITPYLDMAKPNYATIPLKVIKVYNCADADLGKRLEVITRKMAGPLLKTYVKAAFIIDDMQTRGPYLDRKYYRDVAIAVPERLALLTKTLKKIAFKYGFRDKNKDKNLNLNAPQQCADVIYKMIGLKPIGSPDDKKYNARSTAANDLKLLAQQPNGKFPKLLIEWRELAKMEGTYLQNYLKSADMHDGQLRTLWWLTGTITGRLRSGGKEKEATGIVNMQNLHGEPMLKNLLVSDLHWRRVLMEKYAQNYLKLGKLKIFSAFDYSQIEIRVLAHMSQDPKLLAAVESGDIHGTVGEELTGIPRAEIKTNEQVRTMIKGLHFGIVYGMTAKSLYLKLLSEGVKITYERTLELWQSYFRKFRRVRELIEHLKEFAEKNGYAETIFGFCRPIYTHDDESGRETFWGNQAVNSPIQGAAHTLLLIAMALMYDNPETYSVLATPVAEVHDALVFSHATRDIAEVGRQGHQLLEVDVPQYIQDVFGFKFSVPIACEQKAGYRLGSVVEFKPGGKWKPFVNEWRTKNELVEKKIQDKWAKAA